MKLLIRLSFLISLAACGPQKSHTVTKEVCSDDSPAFVLPDEVVCNHAPTDMVEVQGSEITYLCVKQ